MRLTADLVQGSLSYINPLLERELDLRGHKIPAIENLGVARDQDSIDLTDNSLTTLSNFPLSPRLQTLLLARNRIASISPTLSASIPNLTTLVLTQNRLSDLADLVPLGQFRKLTHLTLVENPVARHEHYRLWVLWRCPAVRFLDFVKVKQKEREQAEELFGESLSEPTELAQRILKSGAKAGGAGARASANGLAGGAGGRVKLTAAERKRVQAMIHNAKSLAEIAKLEEELNEGRIPGGIMDDDDEMEE